MVQLKRLTSNGESMQTIEITKEQINPSRLGSIFKVLKLLYLK